VSGGQINWQGGDVKTTHLRGEDGNIYDISNIMGALGLPVAQFIAQDPRDVDHDGIISANDARICSQRCTKTNCVP
jgi:hypothetical protein